jgi:hypothetical protein
MTFSRLFLEAIFCFDNRCMEVFENQTEDQIQDDLILLHRIYPDLSRDQLLEAKENLDRYFALAVRIFLREQQQQSELLDPADKNS